jgi:poly-beta-1,6-N-acetyl-D-glucosamine biosynthesis protein PgaD
MNIIDGLQKKAAKRLERLITGIGWLIMLGYILQIVFSIALWLFNITNFYSKLFSINNIYITIRTFVITAAISICIVLVLYLWGKYNYKKYAHLTRRGFPKNVSNNEIETYFGLASCLIEKMQNDKVIVLEKTII